MFSRRAIILPLPYPRPLHLSHHLFRCHNPLFQLLQRTDSVFWLNFFLNAVNSVLFFCYNIHICFQSVIISFILIVREYRCNLSFTRFPSRKPPSISILLYSNPMSKNIQHPINPVNLLTTKFSRILN